MVSRTISSTTSMKPSSSIPLASSAPLLRPSKSRELLAIEDGKVENAAPASSVYWRRQNTEDVLCMSWIEKGGWASIVFVVSIRLRYVSDWVYSTCNSLSLIRY